MTLSVIIPVYNVEPYLERCVASVLQQTYADLEILLINDGSTDRSGDLCDQLQKRDPRIQVFHKPNGGLSDARNYGIRQATGKYIAFLDSDDFIFPEAYAKLLATMHEQQVDIVFGDTIPYEPDLDKYTDIRKPHKPLLNQLMTGKNYLLQATESGDYNAVSVRGLYQRELITEHQLYFKEGLLHEDELWMPQVLLAASSVYDTAYQFYAHVYREGSITNRKDKTKNAHDLIEICYDLDAIYAQKLSKQESKYVRNYLVDLYMTAIYIGRLTDKSKRFKIDRRFLRGNVATLKNVIKVGILHINSDLYIKVNNLIKGLASAKPSQIKPN